MSIDSITSLRILVGLFKSDVITYEIIPVQNYEEDDKEIINCQKIQEEIQGFVFINCVGEMDLTKYWFCQEKKILALITESKRPIHHQNLRNVENIIIIDDGNNNLEYCPTEKEMEIIRQKVINVDENEIKKKLNLEKNEETEEKQNESQEGENIYQINDSNDKKEKTEQDNEENEEESKDKENLEDKEKSAENINNEKKSKKKNNKKKK